MPVPKTVPPEITEMLKAWSKGESAPADEVFPVVYDPLKC